MTRRRGCPLAAGILHYPARQSGTQDRRRRALQSTTGRALGPVTGAGPRDVAQSLGPAGRFPSTRGPAPSAAAGDGGGGVVGNGGGAGLGRGPMGARVGAARGGAVRAAQGRTAEAPMRARRVRGRLVR